MNAAILVETRPLPELKEIIQGHLKFLEGWDLIIFGSTLNQNLLSDINCTFHLVPEKLSQDEYNYLVTNPDFWQKVAHYEKILIFQHDSMLLRNGIDKFLAYDYVGSPWPVDVLWARRDRAGGNGGLSIRNPKTCLSLCKEQPYRWEYRAEDVYFTHFLENVAPLKICKEFSCETIFELGTLGYHGIDRYFGPEDCELIKRQYENSSGLK